MVVLRMEFKKFGLARTIVDMMEKGTYPGIHPN